MNSRLKLTRKNILRTVAGSVVRPALRFLSRTEKRLQHLYGGISKKYYWEDFVRVYPNGTRIDEHGKKSVESFNDHKNFVNHKKMYIFCAQFVRGAVVSDIGCGSGYGSSYLKESGAARVCGTDASERAIEFAEQNYGNAVEFSVQGITDMKGYSSRQFDVTICSEVLEHVKEYKKEGLAIQEMKRITKPGGIIIIGTPNCEVSGNHGFWFDEIQALMSAHFDAYCLFENALVPLGPSKALWNRRVDQGRLGVVVTQAIKLDETVFYGDEERRAECKKGIPAGMHSVGPITIDTSLLHNTHSWVVVAINS